MKYSGSAQIKSLLWLLGAVAACIGTCLHFVYGNPVWALTDIPFVILIVVAFFESIRGARQPKEGPPRQSDDAQGGYHRRGNDKIL